MIKLEIIGLEIGKINVIKTTEFNINSIWEELYDIFGWGNIQLFRVGTHTGITIPEIVNQFDNFDYSKPIIIITDKDAIYKHIIPRGGRVLKGRCPRGGFLHLDGVKWKFGLFLDTFGGIITQLRRERRLVELMD